MQQVFEEKCSGVRSHRSEFGDWLRIKNKPTVPQISTGTNGEHHLLSFYMTIFHALQMNCKQFFYTLLNYLLHSLNLWPRKRNSKQLQEGRKRKWGERDLTLWPQTGLARWTVNNKLSAQQTSCEHCASSAGTSNPFSWGHDLYDLSAVAELKTAALSDLPNSCQHSCTRGRWSLHQRAKWSLHLLHLLLP